MFKSYTHFDQYEIKYTNYSEDETDKYHILWTVPNFQSILDAKTIREFRTPKDIFNAPDSKYQVKMLFVGKQNELVEIYYITPKPVFLKTIFSICLRRFEERALDIQEYHSIKGNKWQHIHTLYKRDILSREEGNSLLLNDGSFRIKFQFMESNNVNIEHHNIPPSQLSNDFANLLTEGNYSDVIIKSVNGDEFKVHKPVLVIRSDVLKAHFEHNTKESITNVIETSLESEVLREILHFVYTDKSPRIDEIPEKLLAAADFYQLSRLKCLCEEALYKQLTVENAIETLQLAELHSSNFLLQSTLEFIKDGDAKLIVKTQGWAKLQSVDLIKKIYEFVMSDEVEADLL